MAAEQLTPAALARWRIDPCGFIEECLVNPESGEPFVLLPAERAFLQHAFQLGPDGRLLYTDWLYSAPKKSGKTGFGALVIIAVIVLFSGAYGEAICAANAFEQSIARVFQAIRRIIECSPLLKREAKLLSDKITIAGATITAIPSDYASAAGSNCNIVCFDELWAFDSEGSRRLFDELTPPPTRKFACRLVVTYAGFETEGALLFEMYKRGLQQPLIGEDLYGGNNMLMFWSHRCIAPWQTPQWVEQQRQTQRASAFTRQILNEFTTGEASLFDMAAWDAVVQPDLAPIQADKNLHVWIGVDASTKRDSTALVAVSFDKKTQCCRLVQHKVFTPTADSPIDFALVESTLLDWTKRFHVRKIVFDPFQMASTAQRLEKARIRIEPYAQTLPNLTAATQNLFDLVQARSIALYPDAAMRTSAARAIIVETGRGWRISKDKATHHVDVIVALSMAALAAVRGQSESDYQLDSGWLDTDTNDAQDQLYRNQLAAHIFNCTGFFPTR